MKKSLLFISIIFSMSVKSQNVGIGTNTPTAKLEVNNGNTIGALKIIDGTQGQGKVLTSDANGLASWTTISTSGNGWNLNGNAGTTATNFIGTIDGQALRFRINNRPSGIIDSALGCTALGFKSLYSNTGFLNTAYGSVSLFSNTSGNENTAIGSNTLFYNTVGSKNTATGSNALTYNTTGSSNTANGYRALFLNTTGSYNTANGYYTLNSNTTATYNTAVGYYALNSNTTGDNNTANGAYTLDNNTSGYGNTANGVFALHTNQSGNTNTANGYAALGNCLSGNNNTALGYLALANINFGSNNTGLGYNANPPSITASNQVRIGDNAITYAGIQIAWTITSDARWKQQVRNVPMGLNLINKLRPVDYIRTQCKEITNGFNAGTREAGFIAQEVNDVLKELGYDNCGMITKDDNGYYGMRYNDLIPILVKGMQEQQAQIKQIQSENKSLQTTLQNLLSRLEKLESLQKK